MKARRSARKPAFYATLEKSVLKAIKTENNTVILLQPPPELYFDVTSAAVAILTSNGCNGVYVSFQRPYENLTDMFVRRGIKLERLFFVEAASSLTGEKAAKRANCTTVMPPVDVDAVINAIHTSLPHVGAGKRFIFIDSLTTFALYKPLSELLRFSEFLMHMLRTGELRNVVLILTAAENVSQQRMLKDLTANVDTVIRVGGE